MPERQKADLKNMNEICSFVNRSEATVLRWIRELGFPAEKIAAVRTQVVAIPYDQAVANEISVDMRTLQASRADVAKGDALRLEQVLINLWHDSTACIGNR